MKPYTPAVHGLKGLPGPTGWGIYREAAFPLRLSLDWITPVPKPLVLVLTGATYFETGTRGASGQVHGVLPNPLALAGRTGKRQRPCIPRLTTGALLAHFRYAAGTTRGTAWRSG